MADSENVGSNKILKNLGLKFIETFEFDEILHNWYKIEREEFESKNPNR
jgi:ribosomal-protein-alanine N-acetyltransferase